MAARNVNYEVNVDLGGILGPGGSALGRGVVTPLTASGVAQERARDVRGRFLSDADMRRLEGFSRVRAWDAVHGNDSSFIPSQSPLMLGRRARVFGITQRSKIADGRVAGLKVNAGMPWSDNEAAPSFGVMRAGKIARGITSLASGNFMPLLGTAGLRIAGPMAAIYAAGSAAGSIGRAIRRDGFGPGVQKGVSGIGSGIIDLGVGIGQAVLPFEQDEFLDRSTVRGRDKYRSLEYGLANVLTLGLGATGIFDNYRKKTRDAEEAELRNAKIEEAVTEATAQPLAIVAGLEARSLDDAFGTQFMLQMRGNVSRDEAGIRSMQLASVARIAAIDARRMIIERARAKALKEFPVE